MNEILDKFNEYNDSEKAVIILGTAVIIILIIAISPAILFIGIVIGVIFLFIKLLSEEYDKGRNEILYSNVQSIPTNPTNSTTANSIPPIIHIMSEQERKKHEDYFKWLKETFLRYYIDNDISPEQYRKFKNIVLNTPISIPPPAGYFTVVSNYVHDNITKEQYLEMIKELETSYINGIEIKWKDSDTRPDNNSTSDNNTMKREYIPEKVKMYVWKRDEGKCVLCGSNEKLEYDHIIPVSKGGSSTERNIQLLCEKCNRSKSDKIGLEMD